MWLENKECHDEMEKKEKSEKGRGGNNMELHDGKSMGSSIGQLIEIVCG